MLTISDRFGTLYAVDRKPLGSNSAVYHVLRGNVPVARAVLQFDRSTVSSVLVFRREDRRRGIASALYAAIEDELGRPLRPSRIRSAAGRAFWSGRPTIPGSYVKRGKTKRLGPMGRKATP